MKDGNVKGKRATVDSFFYRMKKVHFDILHSELRVQRVVSLVYHRSYVYIV